MKKLSDYLNEKTKKALKFAADRHSGQIRKFSRKPYITHPVEVAKILTKYKRSKNIDDLINASFLHDTVEDTDTSTEELKELFGELTASLVDELTSDSDKIKQYGKAEYLKNKMLSMSNYGLLLKLADRAANTNDLLSAKPGFRKKYIRETFSILNALEKKRKLTESQMRIIDHIKQNLLMVMKEL